MTDVGLAAYLMLEVYRRVPGTNMRSRLARAAWDDAGYCIDATASIPAGATECCEIGPKDDDWFPVPVFSDRGL